MGFLTTHVLDTASGKPACDMALVLVRIEGDKRVPVLSTRTNDDGRCDSPLLSEADFALGNYELTFEVGAYYRALEAPVSEPAFLESVPIRFGIAEIDSHYHVPLLVSPYGYSTYRGS